MIVGTLPSAFATVVPASGAQASTPPQVQFLGDTAGRVSTFTIANTGSISRIGAVEIDRPGPAWTITACPATPAGWVVAVSATSCKFSASAFPGSALAPGQASSAFAVRARLAGGFSDISGTWTVYVSRVNNFLVQNLYRASALAPGLGVQGKVWELTGATLAGGPVSPGAACPIAGATTTGNPGATATVVVCGINHAAVALTPTAAQSSLAGSFIQSATGFSSGPIVRGPNLAVAVWTGAVLTGGSNLAVVATVGSSPNAISNPLTVGGFSGGAPPVARNDAYNATSGVTHVEGAPGVLANDAVSGAAISSFGALSGAEQTSLGSSTPTSAGGSVTLRANGSFDYSSPGGFSGADRFRYVLTNSLSSSTATVTMSVSAPVVPSLAVGDSYAVAADTVRTVSAPGVLANDTLRPGGAIASNTQPGHGAVALSTDGSFTYTPAAGYSGPDAFTYTLGGPGGSSTATVALTVFAPALTSVAPPPGDTFSRGPGVVFVGDLVTIAGCATCSAPVSRLAYSWTMIQRPPGSSAVLNSSTAATPTFRPDVAGGTYSIGLTVTDPSGDATTAQTLSFITGNCGANPISVDFTTSAGAQPFDPWTLAASAATADNSASCPARFAPTFSYGWSVISAPAAYTLSSNAGYSITFTPGGSGDFVVSLTVTASTGKVRTITHDIATFCSAGPVVATPTISVARPAGDSTVPGSAIFRDDIVQLSAAVTSACSSTPAYSYGWSIISRPAGSSAVLTSPSEPSPAFVVDAAGGSYVVSLTVTDQLGRSSARQYLTISVSPCGSFPPVVSIGSGGGRGSAQVLTGAAQTLVASYSSQDNDASVCPSRFAHGAALYSWRLLAGPASSSLVPGSTGSTSATFTAVEPGTYVVEVSGNVDGRTATDSFTYNVFLRPVAPVITAPAAITLGAGATASVVARPGMTYSWSVTGGTVTGTAGTAGTFSGSLNILTFSAGRLGPLTLSVNEVNGINAGATGLATIDVVAASQVPVILLPTIATGFVTVGNTYSASVTPNPGMTYHWTVTGATIAGGQDTPAIGFTPTLPAGQVVLKVTETNGVGDSSAATVTLIAELPPVAEVVTGPVQVTVGAAFGVSAARRPGFTYSWSLDSIPASGFSTDVPGFTNQTFTALTVGPHTITVTESNHDTTATGSLVVTAAAAPVAPAIATTAFTGGDISYVTSGLPYTASVPTRTGMTYLWSVVGGTISSTGGRFGVGSSDGTSNSITFVAASAGPVGIGVTETNSAGVGATGSTTLTAVAPAAAPVVGGLPTLLSSGGSYSASVIGAANAPAFCSFVRLAGTPASGILGSTGSLSLTVTAGGPGPASISCVQVNLANTASPAGTALATIFAPPVSPSITAPTVATAGRTYSASVPASPASRYSWTIDLSSIVSPGGGAGVLSADGSFNSIQFLAGAPGSLTIAVVETNAAGDSGTSGTAAVAVVAAAKPPTLIVPGFVSVGSTVSATVLARPFMSYQWTAVGAVISGPTTGSAVSLSVPSVAGPFEVDVTESNGVGDSFATTTAVVQAVALPRNGPPIAAPSAVTAGTSATATAVARPGMTYSWTLTDGSITSTGGSAGVLGEGTTSITFTVGGGIGIGALTIGLVESNPAGTAGTAGTTSASVYAAPEPPQLAIPAFVTTGSAVTGAVSGSGNYSCSITNGMLLTSSGVLPSSLSLTAGNPGALTLSCVATNAVGTSSAPATASSTVVPGPGGAITAPLFATSGGTYAASVPAHRGSTYSWSIDGGGSLVGSPAGTFSADGSTNSINFIAGGPGSRTLSCTETNGAGDSAVLTPTVVTVTVAAAMPTITMPSQATSAGIYPASAPARSGMTYVWTISGGQLAGGTTQQSGSVVAGRVTTTFTAGLVSVGTGTLTLTLTETNAALDSSVSGTAVATIYPAPTAPAVTVQTSLTAAHTYTASAPARPNMTYSWSVASGTLTGTPVVSAGTATATFVAAEANGDLSAHPGSVTLTETNAVGDSAIGSASFWIFATPLAPVVTFPTNVTAGKLYSASVAARPGMTYTWHYLANGGGADPAPGISASLAGAAANPDGTARLMTFTATEVNPAGDSASTSVSSNVFPAPRAAVVTGTFPATMVRGGSASVSVLGDPGMTYLFSVGAGGSLDTVSGTISGSNVTVVVSSNTVGPLTVYVTETNALGDSGPTSPLGTIQVQ